MLDSGKPVDADEFHLFARETATMYLNLYPWYHMPASIHKLLIHRAEVIRSLPLPIGAYSEEAQESRNKYVRLYKLKHARKTSRIDTITGQFRFLCITSDPIISEIIQYDLEAKERERSRKQKHEEDDLNVLLATPDVSPDQSSSDEDSSFSSTYSSDESDEPNMQADLSLADSELEACVEASCSLPEYYYEEQLEK